MKYKQVDKIVDFLEYVFLCAKRHYILEKKKKAQRFLQRLRSMIIRLSVPWKSMLRKTWMV